MRSAVINLFRDLIGTWASFFSKATPSGVLMCGEREVRGEDVLVKEAAALFRKK
jgi:hypothetical protein